MGNNQVIAELRIQLFDRDSGKEAQHQTKPFQAGIELIYQSYVYVRAFSTYCPILDVDVGGVLKERCQAAFALQSLL